MSNLNPFKRFAPAHGELIAGECPVENCEIEMVCPGCGYCDRHHFISIVMTVAELVKKDGAEYVIAETEKMYSTQPDNMVGRSIIACIKTLTDKEGNLDIELMMTYFEIFTLAVEQE